MAELSVKLQLVEGSTTLATARTHSVVVDRPEEKGGADLGFMGGELLLASQGGCFLSTLVAAARARDITLRGARVTVRAVQEDHPPRFTAITMEANIDADASPRDIEKLLVIAERGCIVANTLKAGAHLTLRSAAAAPA